MMLGQAPPSNFIPKPNRLFFFFGYTSFCDISSSSSSSSSSSCRKSFGNAVLLLRAGYSHTPKHLLSFNPSATRNGLHQNLENSSDEDTPTTNNSATESEGIECVPAITNNDSSLKSTRKLSGNFGRLKTQKVKALIHRTSRTKKERRSDDDNLIAEHSAFGKSIEDNSNLESFVKKKRQDGLSYQEGHSRGNRSHQSRDMMQITGVEEDLDQFENTASLGSYSHIGHQNTSNKSQNSDTVIASSGISVARHSPSRLRGRDSGTSLHTLKSESQKFLKEQRKPLADSNFFSRKSFRDLGYSDYMIESMTKQFFLRPSHVQAMAFTPVIGGKTCVIADQSGSGKTLAYLAPIIQRLRQEELEGHSKSSSQAPRVVILAPTAELASQVLDNCRLMSKSGVPFKSMVVTGGFRQRTQLESLQQGIDVLIATPGRFLFLIKEGFLQLTNLRCAVLDEVDILFGDEDFEVALQCLINSSPVATQYLFVTATLPINVYSKLVEVFPDCEMIMGPSMHRISPRLEEVLVDCSGENGQEKTPDTAYLNKKSALLQLAEESPVPRTIVFCNKIETCRKVENSLKRFDRKGTRIQVLPFHAAMTQESRLASMEEFTRSPSKEVSQFMVCTDRASRGIDFARVDHVILFDFPRDPSEYVRRVGRTARGATGEGKAFIFVVGKQVSLARKIMERNRKGHPLHDVPSAYELMK